MHRRKEYSRVFYQVLTTMQRKCAYPATDTLKQQVIDGTPNVVNLPSNEAIELAPSNTHPATGMAPLNMHNEDTQTVPAALKCIHTQTTEWLLTQ